MTSSKPDDDLFKGMPKQVTELYAESKRHKRARERAEFKQRIAQQGK